MPQTGPAIAGKSTKKVNLLTAIPTQSQSLGRKRLSLSSIIDHGSIKEHQENELKVSADDG
jgi:hypothetical protein